MDFELMFCPYCGGDIEPVDGSKYLCKGCGKSIYTERDNLLNFIRPGKLEPSFREAIGTLENQNPQKALAIANDLLAVSEETDFDAFFLRGAAYCSVGEDGKASMDWKKGLELLTVYTNIDAYICLISRCVSEMIFSKEEEFIDFQPVKYIDKICDEIHTDTNESCKSFLFYNIYMEYRRILDRKDKNNDEGFNEVVPKLFRRVVAYHRNLWCLDRVIGEYLSSFSYDPETYIDDDLEDAHVYDLLSKCFAARTEEMSIEQMRALMDRWDDVSMKEFEDRLEAMMPHSDGMLGKLLSRKSDSDPQVLEKAVEVYVDRYLSEPDDPSEES